MAQPITIQSGYSGMAQDSSRDQLPAPLAWNMVDWIPNLLGAPLRKRGGWVYASSATSAARSATAASAASAGAAGTSLLYTMYGQTELGGSMLLAIDSASTYSVSGGFNLWSINESTGAVSYIHAITATTAATAQGVALPGKPVLHGKRWIIPVGYTDLWVTSNIAAGLAATAIPPMTNNAYNPRIYDGSLFKSADIQSANGGAAGARYAVSYRSRCVLANGPKYPRRLFFSSAGQGTRTNWLDPDAWVDMPVHVTGMCSLPTSLLVFGYDRAIRIRGDTPPPLSDFIVEDLSDQGCIDHRSIATWAGKCLYVNTNGIFLTDSIDTVDLTLNGGMSTYYRALLANYSSSWVVSGTVFRNYYFVVFTDGTGANVDTFMVDLRTRAITRLSNFNLHGFSVATGATYQEMYAAGTGTKVIRCTDIFTPTAANKNDGDGTAVLPVLELACRRGWQRFQRRWIQTSGLTHWLRTYFTYDMRDAASDNPTLQISYVTTPGSTSYTTLARTLAETSDMTRQGLSFGPSGERGGKTVAALGLKIVQTAASSDTIIHTIEAEYSAIESSRLAQ